MNTSGLLRNRIRVINGELPEPTGFIFDYHRVPSYYESDGTAVRYGTFWDANATQVNDSWNVQLISGITYFDQRKSEYYPGQPWLIAGIGDNVDLEFSGINIEDQVNTVSIYTGDSIVKSSGSILNTTVPQTWIPKVKTGEWFDLDQPVYLHSSEAVEYIVSPDSQYKITISGLPEVYTPITLASYYISPKGKIRYFHYAKQKHNFTKISGVDTSGLFDTTYSGVNWNNVGTSNLEFMFDPNVPEIFLNQQISSGVFVTAIPLPWNQRFVQLPIAPIAKISGSPTIRIYEQYVNISGGTYDLEIYGTSPSNLILGTQTYARISGTVTSGTDPIPTNDPLLSTWLPASGQLILNGGKGVVETISYSSLSGSYISGITFTSGRTYADGSLIRLISSGGANIIEVSGNLQISGSSDNGEYRVYYEYIDDRIPKTNISGIDYVNKKEAWIWIPDLEKVPYAEIDISYYHGLLLTYDPSGIKEKTYKIEDININPILYGINHGILWNSRLNLYPEFLSLSFSKDVISGNQIGPVYAGSDHLVITAKVTNYDGAPVPNADVNLALDNVYNIGQIDGYSPSDQIIQKTTNAAGEAKFIYTPPSTIHGLGYFVGISGVVGGSGLELDSTKQVSEIYTGSSWKTLLFSVWNDDEYLDYSETSGLFDFTSDGRFELITFISGSSGGFQTWHPVEPVALLDEDNNIVTSGRFKTVVYPSGSLPDDPEVKSYFISAEKHISMGAAVYRDGLTDITGTVLSGNQELVITQIPYSTAHIVSESKELIVGIPDFMKGSFLWGPVDDPDTKAFDSLSYLTINPFQDIDPDYSRFEPRTLGNVFRVKLSKTDEYLRNKLYINPSISDLNNTIAGQQKLRRFFTFRNRVILEVT